MQYEISRALGSENLKANYNLTKKRVNDLNKKCCVTMKAKIENNKQSNKNSNKR